MKAEHSLVGKAYEQTIDRRGFFGAAFALVAANACNSDARSANRLAAAETKHTPGPVRLVDFSDSGKRIKENRYCDYG